MDMYHLTKKVKGKAEDASFGLLMAILNQRIQQTTPRLRLLVIYQSCDIFDKVFCFSPQNIKAGACVCETFSFTLA